MASALESIPLELLAQIARSLQPEEISAMMRSSSTLYYQLEPSLYCSEDARNRAMRWACSYGHLYIIRRLVTVFNASPSGADGNWTLGIALQAGQLDAFRLLLQLGARIDDDRAGPAPQLQLRNVVRKLSCFPNNHEFARAFYQAGRAAELPPDLLDLSLVLTIRCGLPVDLVQLLLDQGASVSESQAAWVGPYKTWLNPLSASILSNSAPVFQLLCQRNAAIHGTDIRYPRQKPLHIPIYAATYSMLEHGTAMVQACLDSGADINHPAVLPLDGTYDRYYYATPLLGYLDSIKSWPAESHGDGNNDGPIHHLQYLFNRGAVIPDNLPVAPFPGPMGRSNEQTAPHSSLDLILHNMKRDRSQLGNDQFQAVARLLIQHGALSADGDLKVSSDRIKRLLLAHDGGYGGRPYQHRITSSVSEVEGWRAFVTLLIDAACSLEEQTQDSHDRWQDELLSDYIYARGTDPNQGPTNLTLTAISVIISRADADINAYAPLPVLHRLCHFYHLLEVTHHMGHHDPYVRLLIQGHGLDEQRRRLVRALVGNHGANPDLRVSVNVPGGGSKGQGETTEEILLRESEGLQEYTQAGRDYIKTLIEEIRGAKTA
ncbi:hypothetical protein V8F20_006919 [Naviculisporaceae sp. PSN 640]